MAKCIVLQVNDGFSLEYKGRELRTPAGVAYVLPTKAMAEAVAQEWEAQDEKKINPKAMPLTQFAATAIDIIPKDREMLVNRLASYAGSDLLCHRADDPVELIELQAKIWQPIIDWCEKKYSVKMFVGAGIMPLVQREETLSALNNAVAAYDNLRLVGLQSVVESSGSLVLGLAMLEGNKNAQEVFEAAELDCSYQISRWGEDYETTVRRDGVLRELKNAERWLGLLS